MDLRLILISGLLAAVTSADESALSREDSLAKRVVSAASNAFGFDLYKETLQSMEGNAALSPLSLGAALALALQGAEGRTAQQLSSALHLADAEEAAKGFGALFASQKSSEQVLLRLANGVFTKKEFPVKQGFRDVAANSFRAFTQDMDFNEPEQARAMINAWVKNETAGVIPELISEDQLSTVTVMVLLNAIYFKGNWKTPFDEGLTRDKPFFTSPTSQIMVPTMSDEVELGISAEPQLNATVLQLYYNDNSTRMLIFVPNTIDGLENIEKNISLINLHALTFDTDVVQLHLPKFKVSFNTELANSLKQLGIKDLFDGDKANLTALTDYNGIFASKVIHTAVVEVSEKGTEAAGATGIEFVNRFGALFKVDRPFIFMIVNEDNTILFLGRVTDPSAN